MKFDEANEIMKDDPERFKALVQERYVYYWNYINLNCHQYKMTANSVNSFACYIYFSLRRQVAAINRLTARGMFFWDYGNAFLLEASRAGKTLQREETLQLCKVERERALFEETIYSSRIQWGDCLDR